MDKIARALVVVLACTAANALAVGAPDHIDVEKAGGGAIVFVYDGVSINVQFTVKDASGNTVTTFNGSGFLSTFVSGGAGGGGGGGGGPIAFTAGVVTMPLTFTSDYGTATVTMSTSSPALNGSAQFPVYPANFAITILGSNSVTAGATTTYSIGVTGQFPGTLHYSSSDPLAILPADSGYFINSGGDPEQVTFRTAGVQTLTVSDVATGLSSTKTITVAPLVTWTAPADIVGGTPLGAEQLNASAIVSGTFVYSPPAGTVLSVGLAQPLSVTFIADSNYVPVTVSTTINVLNAVPAFVSPPTAAPNPAPVNSSVTFTCAAADRDNEVVSIGWDFGDGAAAQGAAVSHTYTAAGVYDVAVTATDAHNASVTAHLALTVQTQSTNSGGGNDSGAGDASGSGSGSATTAAPLPLTVSKLNAKTFFKKANHDTVSLSGTLPDIPAPFAPNGLPVSIDIGGATADFVLNAHGQAKSAAGTFSFMLRKNKAGGFDGGNLNFKASLKNGSWSATWANIGGNTPAHNASASMAVVVTLNGVAYSVDVTTRYSATQDKSGTFLK